MCPQFPTNKFALMRFCDFCVIIIIFFIFLFFKPASSLPEAVEALLFFHRMSPNLPEVCTHIKRSFVSYHKSLR